MAKEKLSTQEKNVELLNAVRENASEQYQEQVPVATLSNLSEVGRAVLQYDVTKNEFTTTLINKIALTVIRDLSFSNPLARFKKGDMPYGKTIEEIWVDLILSEPWNIEGTTVDKRRKPSVKVCYHEVDRKVQYPFTVSDDQVRECFTSASGVYNLAQRIIDSAYTSDQYDEYLKMKELISKGNYKEVLCDDLFTGEGAKKFLKLVKDYRKKLSRMSTLYNEQGVKTLTDKNKMVLFVRDDVTTEIDVEVLAGIFNLEKIEIETRIVEVEDFDTLTDTYAILLDERAVMVYDKLFKTTTRYNEEGLYMNYFIHRHQLLSLSPFMNGVRFKKKTV